MAADLHFGAGVLAEEDAVALLHLQGGGLSVFIEAAVTDCDDLALLGLFLGGVGDDDPALHLLAFVEPLHEDAVIERTNLHLVDLPVFWNRVGSEPRKANLGPSASLSQGC